MRKVNKILLTPESRFKYDVLNHTDLSRYSGYSGDINLETINWSNYDLLVIDESHNFRNNNPQKDRVTRYSRLMNEVIKKGVKTKVLMLSATPVNNRMNDIKNQIAFITEGNDFAFEKQGIHSIEQTLRRTQLVFNRWTELDDEERTVDTFIDMMHMDYFKLLDTVTLARSRKHIEKYYNINEIGKFPERLKPINKKSEIDIDNNFPSIEDVNKTIRNLNLSQYSPLKYLLPSKRERYGRKYDVQVKGGQSVFRQTDREQSLISLMRVNLLKRLESSIHSFGMTISKILREIDYILDKIENKQYYFYDDMTIEDIDFEDDVFDEYLIGNKVKVLLQDMDLIKWKQDLLEDKGKLEQLLIESAKVTNKNDAKLGMLKDVICHKIRNPINSNNNKIIIFTAFADTARYLYDNLAPWLWEEFNIYSGLVTGSGSNQTTLRTIKNKDINSMLTNFSPISKDRHKVDPNSTDEIDILVATDCISEGQNLQDCDYLINYDIHWNPVRIVQRFGRIDRIGSINDYIQLVNFWPNIELDEYINLEARVTGKMVLMDVSATGEENVIEFHGNNKMNDLEYRRKQLEQLQDEVIDIEEMAGGISITDLTLNDFKMDLMEYMKRNKDSLSKAPLGLYAVASRSQNSIKDEIKPGVIFTLRQVKEEDRKEKSNSLYPYYMVYIQDDGKLKYNYTHSKRILDYYKKLCSGQNQVLTDLVSIFNEETSGGKNMDKYSYLLEQSINSIIGKKEEKGIASLFSKGGTRLSKNVFTGIEDFELISFLVIK